MPRPKRATAAPDLRTERQRAFEHELLTAPCRHHMKGAVCDQCVSRHGLDSLGFPNVAVANGRGRYRLCAGCRKLNEISEWQLWTDRCQRCSPGADEPYGRGASGEYQVGAKAPVAACLTRGPHTG